MSQQSSKPDQVRSLPSSAGGGTSPGRGPGRISPGDRKQLASHPVSFSRIAGLFAPHKLTLLAVVSLISVSSLASMVQPFLVRAAIDTALPSGNMRLLAVIAASMVGVAGVIAAIGVAQTWLATRMGQDVMHELRTKVFSHLQRQSLGFFTKTRGGEVQSRLTHDISAMQGVITSSATSVASQLTTSVATVVAMLALSPRLTALSLLVLPPATWLTRKVAVIRRELTAARQSQLALLHHQVEEGLSISGIKLSKTLGTQGWNTQRFEKASRDLIDLEIRSQLAGQWRMATMSLVFAAIPAAIYLVAAGPIAQGSMTIGTLVAFTALQATLFRPVMGLLNVGVQWVSAMALFSRIFEYMDMEPDIVQSPSPTRMDPRSTKGEVSFEGVSFGYDDADPILRDINLHIPSGSSLAIVGPTGSGKSTLAGLLTRLHDPDQGRVTIDGVDVKNMHFEDLASIVGVVTQETYLIHTSIKENLLLGKRDADEAELWAALDAAQIGEHVRSLPEGLDTVVGARGHRFSGGEQQRLAIARTILRNPPVLILDEATSALDNTTEAQVQLALDALSRGRTTLTIAHRLSTVESADQIVVLDGGMVGEVGSASELRAKEGLFAALSLAA